MTAMTATCPADLSPADLLELASERCKASGGQLTPIRRDVLALLCEHPNGLKAYDLLARIKELRSNATPPTVYRALDFLMEQGLVHKLKRINQFVACRHDSHQMPGLYMVCRVCGTVTELHDHALMQALVERMAAAGQILDCHEIELASVCVGCREETGGAAAVTTVL